LLTLNLSGTTIIILLILSFIKEILGNFKTLLFNKDKEVSYIALKELATFNAFVIRAFKDLKYIDLLITSNKGIAL
jgi:hypothetical protein